MQCSLFGWYLFPTAGWFRNLPIVWCPLALVLKQATKILKKAAITNKMPPYYIRIDLFSSQNDLEGNQERHFLRSVPLSQSPDEDCLHCNMSTKRVVTLTWNVAVGVIPEKTGTLILIITGKYFGRRVSHTLSGCCTLMALELVPPTNAFLNIGQYYLFHRLQPLSIGFPVFPVMVGLIPLIWAVWWYFYHKPKEHRCQKRFKQFRKEENQVPSIFHSRMP